MKLMASAGQSAAGQAKEMIVVMPYGNPMKLKKQDGPVTAMKFGGDPSAKTSSTT